MIDLKSMLEGVTCENGDSFMAKCPAHDDKSPSLKVTYRENKILLYCYSGCMAQEILDSLDLKWKDLFDSKWTAAEQQAFAERKKMEKVDPIEVEKNIILIMRNRREDGKYISVEDEARELLAKQRFKHLSRAYG